MVFSALRMQTYYQCLLTLICLISPVQLIDYRLFQWASLKLFRKFALKNGIESVMKRLIIFFKKSGGENEDTFI